MAGYRNDREPRRGFDDDRGGFGRRDREPAFPRRQEAPASDPTDATVLWFNATKGFGFVELADGGQAFLHIRALETAGHSDVAPGTAMRVTVQEAQKGKQVAQVVSVSGGAPQAAPAMQRPARRPPGQFQPEGREEQGEGTVKWYNSEKGFGFIVLDGGGKDVFVHASTLARSGLTSLPDGQRVFVTYSQRQKGPEAQSIELA